MSHEIETAMFVSTPAWHNLGTVLDAPPSIAEALTASGLDWHVDLAPLFLSDGTRISDRKAIVRASDHKVLGTVGRGFRTVQNAAAFKWFQPFLDSGLATLEAAGSLRGGARVWILAKMTGADSVIVPQSDDRVTKYLLLAHGHDGSLAIRLGLTPTRVVCANTLSAAIGENATLRIRHTIGAAGAMDSAREIITRANGQFEYAANVFRALASIHVTSAQIRAYIDTVFPAPKKPVAPSVDKPEPQPVDGASELSALLARPMGKTESIFSADSGDMTKETRTRIYGEIETLFEKGRGNDMAGVKGTAWAAYNAVTEYITHERGRSDDNRVNAAWFGAESTRAIQAAGAQFLGIGA
jgi:phage/plasmid-like protein (TIGR03299 family)